MTGLLDDYLIDRNLSLLDKVRIQAQVLVPVLRALRADLGKERADALMAQALRDWSNALREPERQRNISSDCQQMWAAE